MPLDGSHINVQYRGSLDLRKSFVPEKAEDLSLSIGKCFDVFMELGPSLQGLRFSVMIHLPIDGTPSVFVRHVGMMMCPLAELPKLVPTEVNQLPPNLSRRQVDEMLNRRWLHVLQRAVQSQHGVLQYVIRLLPPSQGGIVLQHLASQPSQSITGMLITAIRQILLQSA